jgi:hypothetical protein
VFAVLPAPDTNYLPKSLAPATKILIICFESLINFQPFFGIPKQNLAPNFLATQVFIWSLLSSVTEILAPWQHWEKVLIEMAESFPLLDEEKITKGIVHCEERPAPNCISNEKCAIFSNSV